MTVFRSMGCEVVLPPGLPAGAVRRLFDDRDRRFSRFIESSELNRVNAHPRGVTVVSEELLARIRARAKEGPTSFLIIAPQSDREGDDENDADRRLRRTLTELRSEGIDAHGQIVHPDPFTAVMHATNDERVDEIIVSTYPGERSGWLRRDLIARLREKTGLPVQHVVSVAEQPVSVGVRQ